MESINRSKATLAEREAKNSECLDLLKKNDKTVNVSHEMMKTDVSLIEKELMTSLKLIESGLINLDIEAAYLLNPPGLKKSYHAASSFSATNGSIDIEISSTSSTESKSKGQNSTTRHAFSSNKLDEAGRKDNSLSASMTQINHDLKKLSSPPDLTFSFYSSKECIIRSAPLDSPSSELESKSSDKMKEIVAESENSTFKQLSEKTEPDDGSIIGMRDIADSLLQIKSALDNLDREAEYLLNPLGFKSFYCESSTETPLSLENNELYPFQDN